MGGGEGVGWVEGRGWGGWRGGGGVGGGEGVGWVEGRGWGGWRGGGGVGGGEGVGWVEGRGWGGGRGRELWTLVTTDASLHGQHTSWKIELCIQTTNMKVRYLHMHSVAKLLVHEFSFSEVIKGETVF